MQKRWTIKQQHDEQALQDLAAGLSIDAVLSSLLLHRNIHTFEEARYFFRPLVEHLHDPFLMAGMERAVERIDEAIVRNEKILIY